MTTPRTLTGPVYVTRDGERVSPILPTEADAFGWLMRHQPMSVDWATKHEGYAFADTGAVPWSATEARNYAASARRELGGDADHRAGHPDDDEASRHLTRENCAACVLAGYGSDTDDEPNYSSWQRIYVEAKARIPRRYRNAFVDTLNGEENTRYADALARSIATFGVQFA